MKPSAPHHSIARTDDHGAPGHDGPNVRLVSSEAAPASTSALPPPKDTRRKGLPGAVQALLVLALAGGAGGAWWYLSHEKAGEPAPAGKPAPATAPGLKPFVPTPAQLATFTLSTAIERSFQKEEIAEGKIAVDDDRTTPIYSPYAGRVIRLVARQGQDVKAGEVLFTIQATDMVQAQTDLLAAQGALNKARSQLTLATTVEKRQKDLYEAKAVALREWQSAQNDLVAAQNDMKAAEASLEAVRNRLSILGKTEAEISAFLEKGRISSETPIVSPIAGAVVTRRVGPGQYIATGATDPAFVVGDLSRVWLLASVREADAPSVKVGQKLSFRALAAPDRVFETKIAYVGASIDPASRRVTVRAEVENADGLLKPEMFASVRIATGAPERSPAVPRQAVIYEGDATRVWVIRPNGEAELRKVTTGLVSGEDIQISSGLAVGEKVVSRGSLFIDRLASGGDQ